MDNPEKAYKGQHVFLFPNCRRYRWLPTASDLVRLPELNQARVHKCFLALANRKIITKDPSVRLDPCVFFSVSDHLPRACIAGRASDSPCPTFPMIAVFPLSAIITDTLV